ncbi:MAG TPA: DUF929 family protein [Thermoplasmata archaeon]|nr:DUF929 family protein [Thermoplasmata archaeon]
MVDWDAVEKRRAKGWDWDRIAADPKVGFHSEESAGEPGRALRAVYYQRRSKARRRSGDSGGPEGADADGGPPPTSPLARIGFILTPLFGIWLVLAIAFPSLVGTIGGTTTNALPFIGILLAIGAFLLAFGLLRSVERWNTQIRVALTIGIVLGLVVSGAVALTSLIAGCPNLSSSTTGEPLADGAWEKAANPAWQVNGAATFFYYGSVACPYCSASSWAIWDALAQFGTWSGVTFSSSSPTDVDPSTPSVDLSAATLYSQYVAAELFEDSYNQVIHVPSIGCPESAYVSSYDSGGSIPFSAINGQYVRQASIVDPTQLRQTPGQSSSAPLTDTQVKGEIANQTGAAWNAISGQVTAIEAFIVVSDHGRAPPPVLSDPAVQSDMAEVR